MAIVTTNFMEKDAGSGASLSVAIRKSLGKFTLDSEFTALAGITTLFGASGSGKTTLLNCLAGLSAPDSGRIVVGDRVLFDSEQRIDIPAEQRNAGYVFQDLALFPHLSVGANVEYGLVSLTRSHPARAFSGDTRKLSHCGFARSQATGDFRWAAPAGGAGSLVGNESVDPAAG